MNSTFLRYITLGTVVILAALGIWFFLLRSSTPVPAVSSGEPFGSGGNVSNVSTTDTEAANETQQINTAQQTPAKVFSIASGPVAGATFIQTLRPTTTVARYVMATNGHVFDLVLDNPGAVPRTVSNTTIPGATRAVWTEGGRGVILQYTDEEILKSVHLALPSPATSTSSIPPATRIQFLPDNAESLTASPDGERVAYLLQTAGGVEGYIAAADGSGSEKLFSLPLSELTLTWPSPSTLLVETKAAAGVPGMVFSARTTDGAVVPLLYAVGVTAVADSTFSHLVYQTVLSATGNPSSYVRDLESSADISLLFGPFPEKCIWSEKYAPVLYCALPLQHTEGSYLDYWHLGVASTVEGIFGFNITTGVSDILATPGSSADGGAPTVIESLAVSPDEHYLLFVARGNQSLWGVRLSQ